MADIDPTLDPTNPNSTGPVGPITPQTARQQPTDPLSLHYGSAQPGEGVLLTPAQRAAAGTAFAEPQIVQMDVLRDGSFNGDYYHAGDTAHVPQEHVETLMLSGFAARADRAELSQQARDAEKARVEAVNARRRGRSTAVAPMGTTPPRNVAAQPQNPPTSGQTPEQG